MFNLEDLPDTELRQLGSIAAHKYQSLVQDGLDKGINDTFAQIINAWHVLPNDIRKALGSEDCNLPLSNELVIGCISFVLAALCKEKIEGILMERDMGNTN